MNGPTHNDLYQQVGRLTGELSGVKESLGKIEKALERVEDRLKKIEEREDSRRGAIAVLATFWTGATVAVGWLIQHFWK